MRDFCVRLFLKFQAGLKIPWIHGVAERNGGIAPAAAVRSKRAAF